MKMIDLTLEDGDIMTFCLSTNFVFGDNYFQDGNHNNGGWKVVESREEIIEKIKNAENI